MESVHGGEDDPTTRPAGGNGPAVPTLNEAAVASAVQRLGTPGNKTRYVTLGRIARADDDGPCVCDLEATLGVSQGAVSQAQSGGRRTATGSQSGGRRGHWRTAGTAPG